MLRAFLAAGLMATLLVHPSTALADANSDKAAAEALFEQGRALLEKGDFAEACKNLEASQRLDSGLGTLLYLADCYEKASRLASAWATFREAASLAKARGEDGRAAVAAERAAALEPRLSKFWLKVAEGNPPGLIVERDGTPIPRETWGLAIPIDAGTHEIHAHAPGREDWRGTLTLAGDATTGTITVPVLAEAAAPAVAEAPKPVDTAAPADDAAADEGDGQRLAGLLVGGAGIIGVAVGAIFGMDAMSKNDDSLALCDPDDPTRCSREGKSLRDDAASAAMVSNIAFGIGGAALATGIVLYVTAPSAPESTATRIRIGTTARAAGAELSIGGRW